MPVDNNPHAFLKSAYANFAPDQLSAMISDDEQQAASETKAAVSLLTAFNNHILTFEKSNEVQCLDFSSTVTDAQNGPVQTMTSSNCNNWDFLTQDVDGKQHALAQFGSVIVYMS